MSSLTKLSKQVLNKGVMFVATLALLTQPLFVFALTQQASAAEGTGPSMSGYFNLYDTGYSVAATNISGFDISDPGKNELKYEIYQGDTLLTWAKAQPRLFTDLLSSGANAELTRAFIMPGLQIDNGWWDLDNDFVWTASTEPTKVIITATDAQGTTVVERPANSNGRTYANVLANAPKLQSIDAYYRSDTYKGVSTDIRFANLKDASRKIVGLDVILERENGTKVAKSATQTLLDGINAQNGATSSRTAPIVIQPGTYDEAGSSSWIAPPAWTGYSAPKSVTVKITIGFGAGRANDTHIIMTDDTISEVHATKAEVMPTDAADPTFAITSPVNGTYVRGTQTIKAAISDESDITKVLMNIAGISRSWTNGASTTITHDGDIFSTTVDTTTLPDGPVWVTLRGTDGAGNTRYWNNNAKHRQHVFTVDNTKPVLKVNLDRKSYVSSGAIVASSDKPEIEATDANLDRIEVWKDGAITGHVWSATSSSRRAQIGFLSEGTYVIKAIDKAGNSSDDFTVTIDKTKPTIVVSTTPGSTNPTSYSVLATDNVQLKQVTGHVYDESNTTLIKSCSTNVASLNVSTYTRICDVSAMGLADGVYTIRANARDMAGLLSSTDSSVKFTIDTTAPRVSNISIDPTINGNIGGSNVTVYFDLTDLSGIDLSKTYVMFADGPGTSNQLKESVKVTPVHIAGNSYKAVFDTFQLVKTNYVGSYNLQFTMVDTIGKRTSSKPAAFRSILVDNSGPGSTLVSPSSGSTISGLANLALGFSDDTGVASVRVRLTETTTGDEKWYDGTVLSSTTGELAVDTTVLPDGEYTVAIRPVDSFGRPRLGVNKGILVVSNSVSTVTDTSDLGDDPAGNQNLGGGQPGPDAAPNTNTPAGPVLPAAAGLQQAAVLGDADGEQPSTAPSGIVESASTTESNDGPAKNAAVTVERASAGFAWYWIALAAFAALAASWWIIAAARRRRQQES